MGSYESRSKHAAVLAALAALCLLAYARSLSLPFISDDYVQIRLARDYGPFSGWPGLAQDALYRCRATSLVLTYWTERWFGLEPLAYRLSSLFLHVLNTWLVYWLGRWRIVGRRVALPAAAFFAVHEGHQEAVIWYAALPELLVFLFSLLCLTAWIRWLESGMRRTVWWAAALAAFALALASKESAVATVGLLVLAAWSQAEPRGKALAAAAPFAVLAALYAVSIFAARSGHLHFGDGTFSLQGPFWLVLPRSAWRLFWFWGLLSLLAIGIWRRKRWRRLLWATAAWMVVTFLPYSFLTYMPHVPSRHTYFASVGLAWVVGAGFLTMKGRLQRRSRWAPAALVVLIILHNSIYLWTRKQRQFAERAAPTEALVEFAAKTRAPVVVECFPYSPILAEWAVQMRLQKNVHRPQDGPPPPEAPRFCWQGPPERPSGASR